jgi:hypothetical protein
LLWFLWIVLLTAWIVGLATGELFRGSLPLVLAIAIVAVGCRIASRWAAGFLEPHAGTEQLGKAR